MKKIRYYLNKGNEYWFHVRRNRLIVFCVRLLERWPYFFPVSVSFILVTVTYGVYHHGMLLFGDTDLTYHFGKNFFNFNNIYLWNDYFQSGIFDFDKFQALYLKKIIFFFHSVFSLYFFSYLWYFLPVFTYIISFYFLILEILKLYHLDGVQAKLIAVVLSSLAFSNGIFIIYYGEALMILSLALVNLFLLFFTKNLFHLKKSGFNHYGYLVLSGLFLSQIGIYIHNVFLLLYAVPVFAILNYSFFFKHWRAFLFQGFLLAGIVVTLNAQWLIPVFSQSFMNSSTVRDLVIYDPNLGWEQAKSISNNIYMFDLLKMKSYHILDNHPSFFNIFYYLPFGIILFFLTKKRKDLNTFFVMMLLFLVIFLTLSYGIKPFSEFFYQVLWNYVPLFTAFRTIFKFAFLYLYAIVFALAYILATIKKSREYFVIVSLLFLNIVFSVYYYSQPEIKRNLKQYTVPEYYFSLQAANLAELDNKLGNNISSPQFNWQFQYEWAPEKVDGMNILPYFYGSGFLINGAQDTPTIQYIYNDFFDYNLRNNKLDTLKNLLSIRNIKFITYQDDLRVTDNESTPYVVKSNLEEKPKYQEVITEKFVTEICSSMTVFDKLSICQVKNSLFTPLFQVKNIQPIEIKNERYLADLKGVSYFTPYNKRTGKGYPQVNLIEENPIIVDDLMQLGITDTNDVRLFETKIQKPINDFSAKKSVYPSLKSFEVKNCYYQMGCSLFFFQDIEPGRYHIYYVRHPASGEAVEDKEYSITVSDQVPGDFIQKNVQNLQNREDIQDYKGKEHSQLISFISKRTNDLGEIDLTGPNTIIRTLSDNFFSNGTFYLVRDKKDLIDSQPSPQIEFKKINPTKFRVRIHSARGVFPLVFSENFDKNWRIYDSPLPSPRVNFSDIEKYVPLQDNNDDQATKRELSDFIQNGLVTDLGNLNEKTREHMIRKNGQTVIGLFEKYRIDFISKNLNGTIQNDNLPEGKLWETWFRKPFLGNASHFENDGYSNGWVIDSNKVCENNGGCVKNADGTVDFELVVEFWPQRLLYVGLGISIVTFLVCITFLLLFKWRATSSKNNI